MTDLQAGWALGDLTVDPPPAGPADWNDEGVVAVERLMDDDMIAAYLDEWKEANGWHGLTSVVSSGAGQDESGHDPARPVRARQGSPLILRADRPGGWADCTPYRRHRALRDVVCDRLLAGVLESLLGERAGVHLILSGLVSTRRDWHQDQYLNPPHVGDYYAAVWFALGDVHPDSGPFQYIPGSHRWPQVDRAKLWDALGGENVKYDDDWPRKSERLLSPLFEREIAERGATIVDHLPAKGDVLVWHGRLLHRGSTPKMPDTYRPGLIAHYSGLAHRSDMPAAVQAEAGGWLFPLGGDSGTAGNTNL